MPSSDSDDSAVDWDSLQTVHSFDGCGDASAAAEAKPNSGTQRTVNFDNSNTGSETTPTPTPPSAPSTATGTTGRGSTQLVAGAPAAPATFIDHITHGASTPVSLLVESLVQQLCSMLDTDPDRSAALYLRICEQLHRMRLIDATYSMGEFEMMRSQYQRALYQLVSVARGQELPATVQSVWPLTSPIGMDWSRYHREFDELQFVAGGGFGKVFRARHKLDGIVYAVKKVTIRSITIGRILSHLAEVKTLAGLNHQNVVAYKAAWLEPLLEEEEAGRRSGRGLEGGEEEEEEDGEDETESEFSVSVTRASEFAASVTDQSSASFIQFASRTESRSHFSASSRRSSQQQPRNQQLSVYSDTQAHLNLKWATLYIQMTLCQMTLREWLDERNQADDFGVFYAKFRANFVGNETTVGAEQPEADDELASCPEDVAHEIFRQLIVGLEYIHSRGIIHHDIKPSNVFVGMEQQNGRLSVQLGDFGLACPLQEEHRSTEMVGTPTYAAPEQLRGCCDPKSDIFSCGVVLVELLMPFGTAMERIRTIEVVRAQQVPEKFPEPYTRLLRKLIASETTARPGTAQILASLTRIRRDETAQAAQRQVDALTAELARLRADMQKEGPALRAQLSSKMEELRTKNTEIGRLQRQIVVLRRTTVEMRAKDAEIRRLRAALRRRSRRGELGAGLEVGEEEEVGDDGAEE